MKAVDFLNKAAAIMEERGKQYDKPEGERSMGRAVEAFNVITRRDLTEAEGWLLLQVLKDVRQWQNPEKYHADSAEDSVAYSALKAEALAAGGAPAAADEASSLRAFKNECNDPRDFVMADFCARYYDVKSRKQDPGCTGCGLRNGDIGQVAQQEPVKRLPCFNPYRSVLNAECSVSLPDRLNDQRCVGCAFQFPVAGAGQ